MNNVFNQQVYIFFSKRNMLERVLTLPTQGNAKFLSDFILVLELCVYKRRKTNNKKDYKSFKVTLKNRLINYIDISLFHFVMDSFKNFLYFQINYSFIFYISTFKSASVFFCCFKRRKKIWSTYFFINCFLNTCQTLFGL